MAEQAWTDIRQGSTSPSADDAAELQSYDVGSFRLNNTPGSSIIGWRCTVAGHAGTWEPIYGGVGGPITLRAAYLAGSVALDQTLPLSDADGGGIIIDGSSGTFTGALSLRINSAAAGPFVVDRANGYVGIGQVTPTAPLEIGVRNGSTTSLLFSQAAHQRIEKTGGNGLSIVVPNTANTSVNWFDVVMGSTSKLKIEPGTSGGSNGVFTLNNNGVWSGTFSHWSTGQTYITGTAFSGSQVTTFGVYAGALTNQNGSVELNDVVFDLSHTVQQIATDHATNIAFKVLAPTFSATAPMTVGDAALLYLSGAPAAGTNMTQTRSSALWIGAGNGGGIRTDGFGASGIVYNNNGGLWTLAVPGTHYVAPWSLTSGSVVISGGGSVLTEDAADFTYNITRSRLHVLGQTVMGSTVGFWGAGGPSAPTLTFSSEDFDTGEDDGPIRDTGFFGVRDNMIAVTTGGLPSTVFDALGLMTGAVQARYILGGTENGRTDASPLVIRGGSSTMLRGLKFDASATFSATSGTQSAIQFAYTGPAGGFAPTSGTATMRYLDLAYEVNQTGGANGAVYGLYIAATNTAVGGTHYGLRVGDTTTSVLRADAGITAGSTWVYVGEAGTGNTGFSGIQAFTNARSALFYLDNATGNIWLSNRSIWGPTAVAATPTFIVTASGDSGLYGYSAGIPAMSAAGRYVSRFISTATERYVVIGEQLTGITYSFLSFETNVRAGSIYMDNSVGNALIPSVPIYAQQNGTHGSPQFAFVNQAVGLYYPGVAGQIGISGTPRSDSFGVSGLIYNNHGAAWSIATAANISSALGLTGPAVVWTNGSGVLSVDTARFAYDSTNFKVLHPNGTATHPGLAPFGDPNTGPYSYGADQWGVSTGGRHTARFESDASSRFLYVGEGGTGIGGYAYLGFATNARAGAVYLDNAVGNTLISTVGWLYPNGSAAGPAVAWSNSTDTGRYRYGAGVEAVAAAGRYVSRWESDASSRWTYIGEQSTGITGWSMLTFHTNVRAGSIYVDNATGNALIASVAFLAQPNGSFAGPSWTFLNDTGIGLYRRSSGVLGLAGRVVIGDTAPPTTRYGFSMINVGDADQFLISPGGGSLSIADGVGDWAQIRIAPNLNNVDKAATPTPLVFSTVRLLQSTLTAVGASGTARIGSGSATLYIDGPPVLSGAWSSAGAENAVNVASGRVQILDELNVGGAVFNANRNGGTPRISFFGVAGVGQQASGGTLAGVIAGLVAQGLFSS